MIKFEREDGMVLDFSKNFGIKAISGATDQQVQLSTVPRAVGHGDMITGRRLGGRIITVEAEELQVSPVDENRQLLRGFFNPFFTFKVYLDYKGESLWQYCQVNEISMPTENIYQPQQIKVSVYCPDPWWNSSEPEVVHMYKNLPMLGFPMVIPKNKGVPFGVDMYSVDTLIDNTGDLEANCKVRLRFVTLPGGVENLTWFKLIKNEKEFLLINKNLSTGELWEIDFDKRLVTLNGENANRFVHTSSTFFSINPGGSSISYQTSDVRGRADCTFTMFRRYL